MTTLFQLAGTPFTNTRGEEVTTTYYEGDPLHDLDGKMLAGAQAVCFYKDKLVVIREKEGWTIPGGTIEEGESYVQATIREVAEETNMKVIEQKVIGYQDFFIPGRIVRHTYSFCRVEPIGEFVSDPDGDVLEVKHIDPLDYKQYLSWRGVIGDRIMQQALHMLAS